MAPNAGPPAGWRNYSRFDAEHFGSFGQNHVRILGSSLPKRIYGRPRETVKERTAEWRRSPKHLSRSPPEFFVTDDAHLRYTDSFHDHRQAHRLERARAIA